MLAKFSFPIWRAYFRATARFFNWKRLKYYLYKTKSYLIMTLTTLKRLLIKKSLVKCMNRWIFFYTKFISIGLLTAKLNVTGHDLSSWKLLQDHLTSIKRRSQVKRKLMRLYLSKSILIITYTDIPWIYRESTFAVLIYQNMTQKLVTVFPICSVHATFQKTAFPGLFSYHRGIIKNRIHIYTEKDLR